MIVNPGIRRFLGSAIQRLFNSASFYAPLTHTAVPVRAATGTTATFTRATTKTVENNDGYLVTLLSGEIGFPGARRVRNLLTFTEDFSNAAWLKANITVTPNSAVAPDGTTSATKLTATAAAATYVIGVHNSFAGTALIANLYVKKSSGATDLNEFAIYNATSTAILQRCSLDFDTGILTQITGTGSSVTSVGNGWYQVKIIATSGIAIGNNINLYIGSLGSAQSANEAIYVWHPQIEDITARADQTTPSEYVSVGVESAPYYHGSFVDGVKCFPTDLSGNPLTTMLGYSAEGARTNLCLQSQTLQTATWAVSAGANPISVNSSVAPDGTTTADLLYEKSDAVVKYVAQSITITTAAHTWSVYAKENGRRFLAIDAYDGSQHLSYFDLVNGTTGTNAAGNTSSIESVGDGWYRCSVTRTAAGTGGYIQLYLAEVDNSISYTGDGSSGIYLWGAQVELGSFASSYIATEATAQTRNADVLTYSLSGNMLDTKGWAYGEVTTDGLIPGWNNVIVGDANAGSYPLYLKESTAKGAIYDGTTEVSFGSALTIPITSPVKVASTWGGSTMTGSVSGSSEAPGSFDGVMNITNIGIGHAGGNSQPFGNIGPIYIGQRQLSASEMQAITS